MKLFRGGDIACAAGITRLAQAFGDYRFRRDILPVDEMLDKFLKATGSRS
jgi:hypothetical protein